MASLGEFLGLYVSIGFLNSAIIFACCVVLLLGRLSLDLGQVARRVLEATVLIVMETILNYLHYLLTGSVESGEFFTLAVEALVLLAYACLRSGYSWQGRVVRCVTFLTIYSLLTGLVGVLGPATQGAVYSVGALPNALMNVADLAFVVLLVRFSIEGFAFVPMSYVIMLVATDAICLVLRCVLSYDMPLSQVDTTLAQYGFVVEFCLLVLVTLSYILFYYLAKEHNDHMRSLVIRKAEADSSDMLEMARSTYESLREARHELKNHDAYMRTLIDAGEYDKLRAYFDSYQLKNSGLLSYVQSGNRVIDAVVNAEMSKAHASGVELKCMLAVPKHLPYDEADLYSLLANLLDNAIEGTLTSASGQREVRLSIRPQGGYFIVMVSNPTRKRVSGADGRPNLSTTKKDTELHGWGTKVISRIARRYAGTATFKVEAGEFVATVMLANPEA